MAQSVSTQERSSLPLHVEPDALAYIRAHGGHVMLRRSPRHGCCGGRVYLPVVDLGQPKTSDDYLTFEQQGVQFHIERPLILGWRNLLTIGVTRIWHWHKLWVEGGETTI